MKRKADTFSVPQLLKHFNTDEKCVKWLDSLLQAGQTEDCSLTGICHMVCDFVDNAKLSFEINP